jgi:putative transferase (TIGR04331 family)
MSDYFLITTPLEEAWETDKKILFLGEWCKQIHRKTFWSKLSSVTQSYYCNDKEKLKNNFIYSNILYKNLIDELSKDLNLYHKTNHSIRYWKIILGPWLKSFIASIIERYQNIEQLKNNENTYETIILKIDKNIMLGKTYEEYLTLSISDTWNHFIYSEIIKKIKAQSKITTKEKEFNDGENFREYSKKKNFSKKTKIYSLLTKLFRKRIKDEKFLVSDSYLGIFDETKLNIKLRCFPKYSSFELPKEKIVDNEKRKKYLLKNFDYKNEFESLLCSLIKKQIPLSFFENYEKIKNVTSNIDWPIRPKVIFSSNFLNKTIQSFYTAEKIERFNTKLIYGQHGGCYGQFLLFSEQDHVVDICDKFLSWGWSDPKNNKIIPFGLIKDISKIQYNKKNKGILLIIRGHSRYSFEFNSDLFSAQMHDYFKECVQFCKNIGNVMKINNLTVRLHAKRFWNEGLIFKHELPKIQVDEGYKPIHELVSNFKLVVHSYISTGYLESLAANFPTIVFTNMNYFLLNQDTIEDLKILSEAQIFHPNYESAAKFINKNYQNIDDWWNNEKTQKARSLFCKKYANIDNNKINNLTKILRAH